MILDTSKVSLANGASESAIDLQPGRELVSYRSPRMSRALVKGTKIEMVNDAIGLVLSNGQRLCGSRTQMVIVIRGKYGRMRSLADVKIGDILKGERAGMPVTVSVVGLLFFPRKSVRMVGVEIDGGKPFVAESVLCL